MVNECWKAGHRGDYEANHVFDDAVGDSLVSVGGRNVFRESVGVAYFSSLKIMKMIVLFGLLTSGIW